MTKRSGSSRRKKAKERAPAAAAAAIAYPPWVLLEHSCVNELHGSSSSIGDLNTLAAARTGAGSLINVALCIAAPPEASRVCIQVQLPDGVRLQSSVVVASHGDSVLIEVTFKEDWKNESVDGFVYNAGNAACDRPRRPSLLLLPRIPNPKEEDMKNSYAWRIRGPKPQYLNRGSTGLLHRGEDELVVAELKMVEVCEDIPSSKKAAELVLFRCGEWSTKQLMMPPVRHGGGERTDWKPHKVLPVGDRLLCWYDALHGIVFSNVFDENPTLQYVPFPMESPYGFHVRVTAGGDTMKLVNIIPRCCGGDEGVSKCRRSLHAFTMRTWMLMMDDMTWVMDGVVDATEIWALDAYKGLPLVALCNPVVSFDDPNTTTFVVCEGYHVKYGHNTVRLVTVDMRRKSISSVFCYPPERPYYRWNVPMPSIMISDYLNSYPTRNNSRTSSERKIHLDTAAPPPIAVDDSQTSDAINSSFGNLSLEPMDQAPNKVSLEKKILMALQEIPRLACDVMLKAYSILICDNGCRFRSLLELPMNLRKDWLLIEIKAREACYICSACTKDVQHA